MIKIILLLLLLFYIFILIRFNRNLKKFYLEAIFIKKKLLYLLYIYKTIHY